MSEEQATTDLLTRFATAAEKLRGTGAPEVYEWIVPFEECGDLCDGIECQRYDSYAYNPKAVLAGYVMWAMEVIRWHHGEEIMVWTRPEHILVDLESIADAVGGG